MRHRARLSLLTAAALAGGVLVAAPAAAAVTCTHDLVDERVDVVLQVDGDAVTLSVDAGVIEANDTRCGSATTENTDTIDVSVADPDADHDQALVIDLLGGPFAPGATTEGSGTSEIEIDANLGAGIDSLTIKGGNGADDVRFGDAGINLNGDDDDDIDYARINAFRAEGRAGVDVLSGSGGRGTGDPFHNTPLTLIGDEGGDRLTGGTRDDTLLGKTGADRMKGGTGDDLLYGSYGDDVLEGEYGEDVLEGGADDDVVIGGAGRDAITGKSGNDEIWGKSGNDRIWGGNGADEVHGGADHDTLKGGAGGDVLLGDDGNDTIVGEESGDKMYGGDGSDTFKARDGTRDRIDGGSGSDYASRDSFDIAESVLPMSARTRAVFADLGVWVDRYDYGLDPRTAARAMDGHGVRTIYLETATYNSDGAFIYPTQVGKWLEAAHDAGIFVVGWYFPGYADVTRDVNRTVAIKSYRSPKGDRFDGLGVDIEDRKEVDHDLDRFNTGIVTHLRRVRDKVGSTYPIGAIVFPPRDMTLAPNSWKGYPWSGIGRSADVALPMAYWTARRRQCEDVGTQWCPYQYIRDNIRDTRDKTGLPVHVIGGCCRDDVTSSEVRKFVDASFDEHAHGGSYYDYRTTKSSFWDQLERLRRL